ncbi:hypothetical protein A2U01_0088987, partial [Trifolium medium]|nr:hypothetical protein [Trifolium medium]
NPSLSENGVIEANFKTKEDRRGSGEELSAHSQSAWS